MESFWYNCLLVIRIIGSLWYTLKNSLQIKIFWGSKILNTFLQVLLSYYSLLCNKKADYNSLAVNKWETVNMAHPAWGYFPPPIFAMVVKMWAVTQSGYSFCSQLGATEPCLSLVDRLETWNWQCCSQGNVLLCINWD